MVCARDSVSNWLFSSLFAESYPSWDDVRVVGTSFRWLLQDTTKVSTLFVVTRVVVVVAMITPDVLTKLVRRCRESVVE